MESPFNGELAKGVLWTLQNFGEVTVTDIQKTIDWGSQNIRDELRRLMKESMLGLWISERKIDGGESTYIMSDIARKCDLEFLADVGRKSFKFNSDIRERIRGEAIQGSHIVVEVLTESNIVDFSLIGLAFGGTKGSIRRGAFRRIELQFRRYRSEEEVRNIISSYRKDYKDVEGFILLARNRVDTLSVGALFFPAKVVQKGIQAMFIDGVGETQ